MSQFIWQQGHIIPASEAGGISPADRGFTLGDALFETLPCFNGHALWAKEHLARLAASARVLSLDYKLADCQAMLSYGARQSLEGPQILRLQLSRGVGVRGLHLPEAQTPSLSLNISPWSPAMLGGDTRLTVSPILRNATSPTSQHKTANYLDNIMALHSAKELGFEDAVFLNPRGHVTCTTTANLFALKGDTLITPPLSDGVLAGIVRTKLLCAAKSLGIKRKVTSLSLRDLQSADALFLTNSARFMVPVTALESQTYKNPTTHPIFIALQNWLYKTVASETGFQVSGATT